MLEIGKTEEAIIIASPVVVETMNKESFVRPRSQLVGNSLEFSQGNSIFDNEIRRQQLVAENYLSKLEPPLDLSCFPDPIELPGRFVGENNEIYDKVLLGPSARSVLLSFMHGALPASLDELDEDKFYRQPPDMQMNTLMELSGVIDFSDYDFTPDYFYFGSSPNRYDKPQMSEGEGRISCVKVVQREGDSPDKECTVLYVAALEATEILNPSCNLNQPGHFGSPTSYSDLYLSNSPQKLVRNYPLSYQKTILMEDPLSQESFEDEKVDDSDSLICESVSECGDESPSFIFSSFDGFPKFVEDRVEVENSVTVNLENSVVSDVENSIVLKVENSVVSEVENSVKAEVENEIKPPPVPLFVEAAHVVQKDNEDAPLKMSPHSRFKIGKSPKKFIVAPTVKSRKNYIDDKHVFDDCGNDSSSLDVDTEHVFPAKKWEEGRPDLNRFPPVAPPPEFSDFQLFYNSIPSNFIIKTLLLFLMTTILIVGSITQFNFSLLAFLFWGIQYLVQILYSNLKTFYDSFTSALVEKRRRPLTNNQMQSKFKLGFNPRKVGPRPPNIPPNLLQQSPQVIYASPLEAFSLNHPEGSLRLNPKVKRTLKTQRAKISEAKVVGLLDQRPYIKITLPDNRTYNALFDTGSSCCCISPVLLKELQKTCYVPIGDSNFVLQGVVPDSSSNITQTAFIDIALENGHIVHQVPFMVHHSSSDILIGNNMIRSQRWANHWDGDQYYIDLGHNNQRIKAHFIKNSGSFYEAAKARISALSVSEAIIMPQETTVVRLKFPELNNGLPDLWKKTDLLASPLFDPEKGDSGLEVLPSFTRMNKNKEIVVAVKNSSSFPFHITEDMELATITTLDKTEEHYDLREYQATKLAFEKIPRIRLDTCFCNFPFLEANEKAILIQFADAHGNSITGPYDDNNYLQKFDTGVVIKKNRLDLAHKAPFSILLIPDQFGQYDSITLDALVKARHKINILLKSQGQTPLYYFLDPLVGLSINSRHLIVKAFSTFNFSFLPIMHHKGHDLCIRPACRMTNPDLLMGASRIKIHFQTGSVPPSEDLVFREKYSSIFKTQFLGMTFLMFRILDTICCHVHLPMMDATDRFRTTSLTEKLIHSALTELRFMRVPTETEISFDGGDPILNLHPFELGELTNNVLKQFPLFYKPSPRTKFSMRCSEELPVKVEVVSPSCSCTLCLKINNRAKEGRYLYFSGDINDYIKTVNPIFSLNGSGSNDSLENTSTFDRPGRKTFLAAVSELSLNPEGVDDDEVPLDYMSLCDEQAMQEFLETHPGCERDEEIDLLASRSDLPPSVKTDPKLFKDHDMTGIPDNFRPGNWRETDILKKVSHISQWAQLEFAKLLDKHINVLSFYPTDGRPVFLNGEPVVVDVKLKTNEPIFIKPFPATGTAVDVMDSKLDEMIARDEIRPIESPYNMPIILTHHNSANKYLDSKDKKVRMVVDLRPINANLVGKNLYSYLVKGVEQLLAKIQGAKYITAIDCVRAYRSMAASPFLQMITAFRTPSSKKYPHVTWGFRSTCDGLANLPGFYSYLIQQALSPHSKTCTVAHIDDLLIFSKTEEDHIRDIDSVLTDLGKQNFLVSMKKFEPFQKEIQFLGHMIDGTHMWIPESRKSYFDLLKPPSTKKGLQSLLGMCNYMSTFVDSYSMKVGPLYDLLKGKTEKGTFTMDEIQMKSFLQIKQDIRDAEKLHLLDTSKTIYMECDASMLGCGSIVYHQYDDEDGKVRRDIVRYGSRRFSKIESLHHNSLEREAMAILISAKQHLHFLASCPETVIKTDLKSLISILSCYNNPESSRMARISHRLYSLPFKWSLIHIPGVDLPLADGLSRLYPPYLNSYSDRIYRYPDLERDFIMIPPEWRKNPNLILTTNDLLEAMRREIVFKEKSTNAVKEKRLKALVHEVSLLYHGLLDGKEQLVETLNSDLQNVLSSKALKAYASPLTSVSQDVVVTPSFLIENQSNNPKLFGIMTTLRTIQREMIPKRVLKKYRILNDSILVTRKKKNLPFEHPGNLRIVCDEKMTIHILSLLHVMACHIGMNLLSLYFAYVYKCIDGPLASYVKIVCTGCRACRFHRPTNKKVVPWGRIPLPTEPNHTWMIDFMVFKQDQVYKRKHIAAAFNIMDLFSNLFVTYAVSDQTAKTVIGCLKDAFAKLSVPRVIVSDNAASLCRNSAVIHFLKAHGVSKVTTTTPYNSPANKVERMHKLFRDTLQLVKETFHRESQFDMMTQCALMMNSRPLTLSLHPNIKQIFKESGEEPPVITPFQLHYGIKQHKQLLIPMEDSLTPTEQLEHRKKWQGIMAKHDAMLQVELDDRIKQFSGTSIATGDLVLIKNPVYNKESLKYFREVYEVVRIEKARYFCAPLFDIKSKIVEVNGNNLKPYSYSHLFELLPPEIKTLMGENLSPDKIKLQASSDPSKRPGDFLDQIYWRIPQPMQLRNRLTPPSVYSTPAIELQPDSDVCSLESSSKASSKLFSIPSNPVDHLAELQSNPSLLSDLQASPSGVHNHKKLLYKVKHFPRSPKLQVENPINRLKTYSQYRHVTLEEDEILKKHPFKKVAHRSSSDVSDSSLVRKSRSRTRNYTRLVDDLDTPNVSVANLDDSFNLNFSSDEKTKIDKLDKDVKDEDNIFKFLHDRVAKKEEPAESSPIVDYNLYPSGFKPVVKFSPKFTPVQLDRKPKAGMSFTKPQLPALFANPKMSPVRDAKKRLDFETDSSSLIKVESQTPEKKSPIFQTPEKKSPIFQTPDIKPPVLQTPQTKNPNSNSPDNLSPAKDRFSSLLEFSPTVNLNLSDSLPYVPKQPSDAGTDSTGPFPPVDIKVEQKVDITPVKSILKIPQLAKRARSLPDIMKSKARPVLRSLSNLRVINPLKLDKIEKVQKQVKKVERKLDKFLVPPAKNIHHMKLRKEPTRLNMTLRTRKK